jgi:hypothetical protein
MVSRKYLYIPSGISRRPPLGKLGTDTLRVSHTAGYDLQCDEISHRLSRITQRHPSSDTLDKALTRTESSTPVTDFHHSSRSALTNNEALLSILTAISFWRCDT